MNRTFRAGSRCLCHASSGQARPLWLKSWQCGSTQYGSLARRTCCLRYFIGRSLQPAYGVRLDLAAQRKISEQTPEPPEERHEGFPKYRRRQNPSHFRAASIFGFNLINPATNSPTNSSLCNRRPVAANDRILEAQIAFGAAKHFAGPLDGVLAANRAALRAFQEKQKLPGTGELDVETRAQLAASEALFTNYTSH